MLNAGKHVLCEKPLGLNLRQVKEMTGLARKKGVLLAEASRTNVIHDMYGDYCLSRILYGSGFVNMKNSESFTRWLAPYHLPKFREKRQKQPLW